MKSNGMIKLYPKMDDQLMNIKHNVLISFSLFQMFAFLCFGLVWYFGYLPFVIFINTIIPNVILPILIIFFARKIFYTVTVIYIALLYLFTIVFLFIVRNSDNANTGLFIIALCVLTIITILTINWKIGLVTIVINFSILLLDYFFEKKGIFNIVHEISMPKIYFIIIVFAYLSNALVLIISYAISLHIVFGNYQAEFSRRTNYEKDLILKNESLNELNSELEENMAVLEETNDKMEEALKKAEESDMLKTAFLQNISHEIRTPMNAIIGFLNLIKERNYKNKCNQDEYIEPTISASYQLLGYIGDIIELSHFDANIFSIEKHLFNINNVILEIVEKYNRDCESKGLKLKVKNDIPENKAYIKTDQWRVSQILNKLISNAVKYTFKGEIKLLCQFTKNSLKFEVADTGIGIEKYQVKDIFQRFKQIRKDDSMHYGGLGIGLTIVKEIVERLGGNIEVWSEVGVGSRFVVEIPIDMGEKKKEKKSPDQEEDIDIKKILIAEDDISNFKYLELLLSKYEDISVFHAWNGEEAVEIYKNIKGIDAILMDIKMPVKDGISAFREIKKINPSVPIIAVTAYALNHEKIKYGEIGFDGYVTKPVKKGEIIGLLQLKSKI